MAGASLVDAWSRAKIHTGWTRWCTTRRDGHVGLRAIAGTPRDGANPRRPHKSARWYRRPAFNLAPLTTFHRSIQRFAVHDLVRKAMTRWTKVVKDNNIKSGD